MVIRRRATTSLLLYALAKGGLLQIQFGNINNNPLVYPSEHCNDIDFAILIVLTIVNTLTVRVLI